MDLSTYIMAKKYTDAHGGGGGGGYSAGTGIDITGSTISVDADSAPTKNSQKPVTSGGTKSAIDASQNASLQVLSDTVGWTGKNEFDINGEYTTSSDTTATVTSTNSGSSLNIKNTVAGTSKNAKYQDIVLKPNTDYVLTTSVDYTSGMAKIIVYGSTNGINYSELGSSAGLTADGDISLSFNSGAYTTYRIVFSCTRTTSALGDVTYNDIMVRNAIITDNNYEPYHDSVDVAKANNSAIAPVENGSTASQAYAVGSKFMRNGDFCMAIGSGIASGGSFVKDSNYKVLPISDCLARPVQLIANNVNLKAVDDTSALSESIYNFRMIILALGRNQNVDGFQYVTVPITRDLSSSFNLCSFYFYAGQIYNVTYQFDSATSIKVVRSTIPSDAYGIRNVFGVR